ncbi:hypothetical protein BDZ91DRAFT_760323 [Kalaharituber pfeilii]|nr:hypothetical protein BDZ91DRAFT_760323 [Kalaharituber pfeilii]
MFFAQMLFTLAIRMVTFLPFLIILFSSGIAAQATIWSRKEPANPTNSIVQTTGGFRGNADMYGLGVRIGVYLQIFACICAKYLRLERAIESLAFSSGLLRLALLISLSYVTIKEERLEAVDTAIMVLLALISTPPFDSLGRVSLPSNLEFRTLGRFLNQMAPMFRALSGLGLICYSVWFWWTGLETLGHSPCTGTTFFFAKVSLYNWFRWLGRIYTVYMLIALVLMILNWMRRNWCPNCGSAGNSSRNSESTVKARVMDKIRKILVIDIILEILGGYKDFFVFLITNRTSKAVLAIVVNGLIILAIELTIRWNFITGVNSLGSVGQLIPFLVGVGNLFSVWLICGEDGDQQQPNCITGTSSRSADHEAGNASVARV